MTVLGQGARLLAGTMLAWWVGVATFAPELPMAGALAAGIVFAATLVRPELGLLLVAGLAPASALLAPPPARAAELLAWSMLAAWLLRVWQPLFPAPGPLRISRAAALYCAALVASWLTLAVGGAAGVPPEALPRFLLQLIPDDHLILSSPEPETWTMLQSLTGIAVLIAAVVVTQRVPRLGRLLAATLALSLGALAAATLADVARQWADAGYGGWFLRRYVQGERFSVHLADLNAAGSLYVLAGVAAAAMAALDASRRALWCVPLLAMLPALWLTGSRSGYLAAVGALLVLAVTQRRWPLTRRQITISIGLVSLVLLAGAATMDWQPDVRGSAGRAASLRSQFLETSSRMFASSPVFGVGIGRYFDRSQEFMPAGLRELYGNENAHNYFAQQLAELGLVGALLFLGVIAVVAAAGWRVIRAPGADPALLGLFAGTVGYLFTCVTGHPLLVTAAALPFWIACGVLTGNRPGEPPPIYVRRVITPAICLVLTAPVAMAAASYGRATEPPPEQGFHGRETAADGTAFRWMTRHAVTYVPGGVGFVRLRVHAPDLDMPRPLVLATAIGGRVVDSREIPPGRWITYDIPASRPASAPFQRVDFRANQVWTEEVALGRRRAQRPIAVMLGEVRWIPLEDVGRR